MNEFILFINRKKYFTSFIIIFLLFSIYLLTSEKTFFYWDSGGYWDLGNSFIVNGEFSLFNYTNNLRGVWFPLILRLPQSISHALVVDPLIIIRIFSALYISLFCAYLIPKLIRKIFPDSNISTEKMVLFGFFIFFFWRDYFHYPLSDFPAIILLIWSFYFILSKKISYIFLSGIVLGIAVSIRPIYIISFFPFVLFLLFENKYRPINKKSIFGLYRLLVLFLGFLFISIPQIIVNKHLNNSFSPLVQTQHSYKDGLYLQQLKWGISKEKYETNIGSDYPSVAVNFSSKMGESISIKENVENINSYSEYLRVYFKYPVELTCIYAKHFFNGFDIKQATPYLKNVTNKNYIFSFMNYSILFLSLLFILFDRRNSFSTIRACLFFLLLLSPIIIVIPVVIETRFFISIYILIYAMLAFRPNYKELYTLFEKSQKWSLLYLYFVFLLICFILSSTTYANIQFLNI